MRFRDDSFYCCYCGERFSLLKKCTADHLIPKSKGGVDNNYNKRNCCSPCNSEKGSRYPESWLRMLEKKHRKLIRIEVKFWTTKRVIYDLEIKIENLKYIIEYVQSAGVKLFVDKYHYEYYLDNRYSLNRIFY